MPPRYTANPRLRIAALFLLSGLGLTVPVWGEQSGPLVTATPFAPKSGSAGGTRFQFLPPEATGIRAENRFDDPRMWGDLYHEFEIGAIGTGVSLGDFDGDGKLDLFVVGKTDPSRLFRNLGGWRFEDVTEKAGLLQKGEAVKVWKQGSAFVDVNNDGRLDLYVCRLGAPNLLYINQGDGSFKEEAKARGLDISDGSASPAFADYDRDGWMDLYLQTNLLNNSEHPSGQRDRLFHNQGNGTFVEVTDKAGISTAETQGHAAIWWDYDGDGWPDLYVANDFAVPDFLYRNQHDGTFVNVIRDVVPHIPYSSMGADLGDVNNDGLVDFMATEMAASTVVGDQRDMAETRNLTKDPKDGSVEPPNYLWNALYLNTGTGRFQEAARLAGLDATDWTWGVRLEDLDNDGRLDVFATTGMHREIHNTDLIQAMMRAESPDERVRLAKSSPILEQPNIAMRNRGDLVFENAGAAWGLDTRGVSFGAAFGDLDGDGDLDLVVSNYLKGPSVYRNDTTDGQSIVVALHGVTSNRYGEGATLRITTDSGRQTRVLVVERGYLSSSEPVAHFGLGADQVVHTLEIDWPSGIHQSLTDLKAGFRYDVTEPPAPGDPAPKPEGPAPAFVERSAALGLSVTQNEEVIDEIAQQKLLPTRFNRRGPGLSLGHLVDDQEALLVGGTTASPRRVLVRGSSGIYVEAKTSLEEIPTPVNDGPLLVFDADGDGREDVLITRGGGALPSGSSEYEPVLAKNLGAGRFEAATDRLPEYLESVGAAAAADFDRNGFLDIFLGGRVSPGFYPEAPRSALWRNEGGRFVDVTEEVAPELKQIGMVTSALWTDYDGDGWPDLLVALEWGTVRLFRNEGGKRLVDVSEKEGFAAAGRGWWTSVTSADFNGDGIPDYAVGNVGLNTPYRASTSKPAVLLYGDFKKDGGRQVVEGRWENDRLYPWRSRKALGQAVPQVLRKYPKNNPYAEATLEQILGADAVAAATRYEAEQLSSGVFLSRKGGGYDFHPLPRIFQIAPVDGLVAGDFDGDGFTDLYALQNSYAPNPVVGRFDGGLSQWLKGDGQGGFTPVTPAESGLVVPGDAKSLVVWDVDQNGSPDFVGTRNLGPSVVLVNQQSVANFLSVRLAGLPGNPRAVGARVQVESVSGRLQTMEVRAGEGWLSQGSGISWFGNPKSDPLKWVRVLWPNGKVVQVAVPRDGSEVVLRN